MFIYNVTIKVDHSIAIDWLEWLKSIHIPEVIATGCFTEAKVLQLLETDEEEGLTYAIQYNAPSKAMYNNYIQNFAAELRDKSFQKWGDKFIAFRSIMQIVD